MGAGRWDAKDWDRYSKTHVENKATVDGIYTSKTLENVLDPKGVTVRESCDSADNPNSTPLIIALDVTGSMGTVLNVVAREGLNTIATEVYNRKPISDPHIMFMGVGDVEAGDIAPLQVTQFEADIRIAEQLTKIFLERGGGGNSYESYALAWYFAANHTRIDSLEKRNKKGFLFTIGDEMPTPYLHAADIERVLGYKPQSDLSAKDLLTMVSRQYNVYHIMVEEGHYFMHSGSAVASAWADLLGQNAIRLADHKKLAEVIVSILQVANGADAKSVVGSWDGTTAVVVEKAIGSMTTDSSNTGVVRF